LKERQKWLEKFVEQFMFHDVQVCLDGKANFAAALTLSAYTEAIGRLINGNLTDEKGSFVNYITFLKRMGYSEVEAATYYKVVRCGLAHQYFIKGEHTISPFSIFTSPKGIHEQNGVVYFFTETYFDEFKVAYFSYKNDLLAGVGDLQLKFDLAMEGATLPYGVKSVYDPSIPSVMWPPVGMVSGAPIIFVPTFGPVDSKRASRVDNEEGKEKAS